MRSAAGPFLSGPPSLRFGETRASLDCDGMGGSGRFGGLDSTPAEVVCLALRLAKIS